MSTATEIRVVSADRPLRDVNRAIREAVAAGHTVHVDQTLSRHNLAVALKGSGTAILEGSAGYYCAGLLDGATVVIRRNTGWGVAEAMAAGKVTVEGNAGMSAGASIRGGLLHIRGNAGPRAESPRRAATSWSRATSATRVRSWATTVG